MSQGRRRRALATAALVLLCAAPHVLRLLGPTAALTDGFYAHGAFMLGRGAEPYLDFVLPAFPLLEQTLDVVFRLFGASVFVVELASRVVAAGTAVALYLLGRRLGGPRAGALAALGFSWSVWLLHFNLLERESWAALGVALAMGVHVGTALPVRARTWLTALALLLAFLLKITAAMAAVGLVLHLLLGRRVREALALGGAYLALVAFATLLGWLQWGAPFLWQVYLFGFFRNAPPADLLDRVSDVLNWADPVVLLGLVGAVVVGLPRLHAAAGAPVCVLAAQLLFMLVINPAFWEHNLIDIAPACAVLAALLVTSMSRRRVLPALTALTLLVAPILSDGRPWMTGEYGPGGVGFGGWPRESVRRRAAFLAAHSGPDEIVLSTNPWWSLEARRAEFVRYWDLQPVAQGLHASLRADGLRATFAKRQGPLLVGAGRPEPPPRAGELGPYLGREYACAMAYVRPALLAALRARHVALVMEPLPVGVLSAAELSAAGYARFEDHELGVAGWKPTEGVVPAPPARLFQR